MILLYIKLAWRNLLRNKRFTIINILGLCIGIASFVLIMIYVNYEKSYDKFFENSDRIYRVYMDYKVGNVFLPGDAQTYNLTGPTLKSKFPEIEEFVRFYHIDQASFIKDDQVYEITNGHLADSAYFSVFKTPLIKGDVRTALSSPNSIILTEKEAVKIFGNEDPIGKQMTVYYSQDRIDLTITGVLKNVPENTHLKTNFLVSFSTISNWHIVFPELNWNQNNFFTYVLLHPGTNISALSNKLDKLEFDNDDTERHRLEALTDIHLKSDKPYEAEANGSNSRVIFLMAIAVIIILISWLNYVNLSVTKSLERAKTTGIKKASGARKSQLIVQFLVESTLINVIAIILSFVLVLLLLPMFNSYTEKTLTVGTLSSGFYMLISAGICLGVLGSGLYPALLLSNFKPVLVLKGTKKTTSVMNFDYRQSLVIMQFVATIILLIGTITINKQVAFLQNQQTGANLESIVSISGNIFNNNGDHRQEFETLRSELRKLPAIKSVASSQTYPGQGYYFISTFIGANLPNGESDNQTAWYNYSADEYYIPLMEMEIVSGRSFQKNENNNSIMINEKMARKIGFHHPADAVNQIMHLGNSPRKIVGIVKDCYHFGFKSDIPPIFINYNKTVDEQLLVKFDQSVNSAQELGAAIKKIEKLWNSIMGHSTFQYTFIDEQFQLQFEEDQKFNKAFGIFTLLAILIASLGLFGLASYICFNRTKEIGVRKVNGAKEFQVVVMLNADFIKWVVIAFVLACPIAGIISAKWLQSFAYHTEMSWWIYILAGMASFTIAVLTVSWHSWQAARRNPVEALRYE